MVQVVDAKRGAFDPAIIQRIAVTLAALLITELGGRIPLPGVDAVAAAGFFAHDGAHLPFQRLSVFMLGVTPMFSALVLAEVLLLVSPAMRRRQVDPKTSEKFNRGILIAALAFTALQAWGIASGLENIPQLVAEPGFAFRVSALISMLAATGVLAWLASFITKHGLGSGFWLLFLAPTFASAVNTAVTSGSVPVAGLLMPLAFVAAVTFALVALERANSGIAAAGTLVWPVILANTAALWLLAPSMPFLATGQMDTAMHLISNGAPLRIIALAVFVPTFALWRMRSLTEARHPSAPFNTPITIALVLTAIMIAGDFVNAWSGLPAMPGGTTLVIVISVALSVLAIMRPSNPAVVSA